MIKRADREDAAVLAALAIQMWQDHDPDDLKEEFLDLIKCEYSACFLKYIGDIPIAFAQCQLRNDYVEGTDSSPVGYLEGIFVTEEYRKNGFAAELLAECEKWAKELGFRRTVLESRDNKIDFYLQMGYEIRGEAADGDTFRCIRMEKEII